MNAQKQTPRVKMCQNQKPQTVMVILICPEGFFYYFSPTRITFIRRIDRKGNAAMPMLDIPHGGGGVGGGGVHQRKNQSLLIRRVLG